MNGADAVAFLAGLGSRVELVAKDNTDRFWCYRVTKGKRTEFAFDPKTTTGLFLRCDRDFPVHPGIADVANIAGEDVSTALERVFSGGVHKARFKAKIRDASAFEDLIGHLESS